MRGEGVREGCKGAVKIAGNEGGWHSMADGFDQWGLFKNL